MHNFRDVNLEALKIKDNGLFNRVGAHTPRDIGDVIPTRGLPTLKFRQPGKKYQHAYDVTDPWTALKQWMPILKNKSDLNATGCVFIGMGMGYTPLMALKYREDLSRIIVLEPCLDMFWLALNHVDLRPLLRSDKVSILAGDGEIDWQAFNRLINDQQFKLGFIISQYPPLMDWGGELYSEVKNTAATTINQSFSALSVITRFGEKLFQNRMSNLTMLRQSSPIDRLHNILEGRPVILISAGPSLSQSMEALKQVQSKVILIAGDSTVVPLLQNGIVPDIVTTLDFRDVNAEKLSPELIGKTSFNLVATVQTSSMTVKRLPLDQLFFSFQENDTQEWLHHVLNIKYKMSAADSVALLSLGVAQLMAADPIILVGHDFALPSSETDHVKGAVISHGWHQQKDRFISVRGVDGSPVNTILPLLGFKQDFERMMGQHDGAYINATVSGAHIEGTRVADFKSITENGLSIKTSLKDLMNSSSGPYTASDVSMFIKAANEEVVKARKVINQAKKISNHIKKMESLVNAKRKSILKINHPAQLPQNIRAGMQKLQKLRAGLSLFMPMEEIVARMIDEAKTVNETQPADTLFKQIQKDILVSKLEMKGHLHGLEVFINSINSLTAYLSAEDEILNKLEDRTSGENDFSTLTGIYLEAGDANKASKIIDQWMERFPDSVEAVNHKALSSAMLLDFEGAINCWEDVIQKDPGMKGRVDSQRRAMAEYWIERAEQDVVIQNKCIQRALMLWSETAFVLELKESLWPDVWQLVMLNIDNDLIQKAEQVLTAWEPVQSVIPEWYFAMARIRYKQDKFGKAVGMIRSALELKPDIPQWIAFEARVLMETDQFDQGIERLEKAVKLDPLQAVLWEEVGDAFFEHKDFNSAAVAYERCVDALPDMSDVIRKFGDACYNLNQLDTARNAYLLVLEKDPQNRQASDRLAGIEAQIQMK